MKDIEGFEGLYAVTEDGRVWSYPREVTLERKESGTKWQQRVTGGFLNPSLYSCDYLYISLSRGKTKYRFRLHRLIAQTFIPNPEDLKEVNHINGIKTDNRCENLEWCTRKQNAEHAARTGLYRTKDKKV